jgi:tetratricopeptide (TPR) repeat protein
MHTIIRPLKFSVLSLVSPLSLVLIVASLASTICLSQTRPYNKERLLAALRTNVKTKELSSNQLIEYIEQRGVDFEMTDRDEADFRNAGAVAEVIAAIKRNYRQVLPAGSGLLIVNSATANCSIYLDGQLLGATDNNGLFRSRPLRAGRYTIILKKEKFEDEQRSVQINAGTETSENFSLKPIKGQLTVTTNIDGAEIKLDGVTYPTGITNLSLSPGTYELRATKQGFRTFVKTITVDSAQLATAEATLEPVPVEELISKVQSYLQGNNYQEAISSGREILLTHPDYGRANLLTGLAYYSSGQYAASMEFLTKAIALGEQVVLPIKHHHTAFLSDDLCSGKIIVGGGNLTFTSTDRSGHDFTVPANKIYELTPEPAKFGRVHVRVGIQNETKEDKKTYNFHASRAYLIKANQNDPQSILFVRCNNCGEETALIYQLIRQLKAAPAPSLNAPQASEGSVGLPALKPLPAGLESNAGVEPKAGRVPELAFAGRENFQASGRNWTRYKLAVTNRASYSDEMFASAPDLPPCGANTRASRTWVDIFDRTGKRLFGFCALNSADGLVSLWFALPEGQAPPSEVFIVLTDRRTKTESKSNLAAIP